MISNVNCNFISLNYHISRGLPTRPKCAGNFVRGSVHSVATVRNRHHRTSPTVVCHDLFTLCWVRALRAHCNDAKCGPNSNSNSVGAIAVRQYNILAKAKVATKLGKRRARWMIHTWVASTLLIYGNYCLKMICKTIYSRLRRFMLMKITRAKHPDDIQWELWFFLVLACLVYDIYLNLCVERTERVDFDSRVHDGTTEERNDCSTGCYDHDQNSNEWERKNKRTE